MLVPVLQHFPRAGGGVQPIKPGRSARLHIFHPVSRRFCAFRPLVMASTHVTRVSTVVWRWFCRCPEVIGHVHETSNDEEFFTPPTSPPPSSEIHGTTGSVTTFGSPTHGVQRLLLPAQTERLRRRHARAVRQLTSPPPVVAPTPHGPIKAYQRPLKVYRPSWV